jgi:hypothetical protein
MYYFIRVAISYTQLIRNTWACLGIGAKVGFCSVNQDIFETNILSYFQRVVLLKKNQWTCSISYLEVILPALVELVDMEIG